MPRQVLWCRTAFVLWISFVCVVNGGSDTSNTTLTAAGDAVGLTSALELEGSNDEIRPAKEITSFTKSTFDTLESAGSLIRNGSYRKAKETLEELLTGDVSVELSPSEKAEALYLLARVAYQEKDQDALIELLEGVLEYRKNITYEREEEILLRLSKLYSSQKQFTKANTHITAWLSISEEPIAQDLAFAGSFYVRTRDFKRATEYLQKAVDQQNDAGLEVDPQWLKLLRSAEGQINTAN